MSHPIASLAWLQRAAQVTLPAAARSSAGAPAPVAAPAPAAPASAAQELATAVQAAVHPDPAVAPQAPVTETPVPRTEVDPVVQQFTQALVFALHRAGRERDDDGHGHHGGRHPGRGHGDDDGGEHWRRRDGARAYRGLDTLVQRLGDLAAQIRRGDAPATAAPAPAAGPTPPTPPNASPVAPVEVPVPAAPPASATATTAAASAPAPRADPVQRLLDAFSALGASAPPASAPGTPAADAPSARERLARFLEQLAQALAVPGQRAANDAIGGTPRGRLLNVAA